LPLNIRQKSGFAKLKRSGPGSQGKHRFGHLFQFIASIGPDQGPRFGRHSQRLLQITKVMKSNGNLAAASEGLAPFAQDSGSKRNISNGITIFIDNFASLRVWAD
jgi:hypothetical protein